MAGNLIEFTDGNFEAEVLKSAVPTLVDFTAVWCQPCKAIKPIVESLAGTYAGRVKVGTMDVDAHKGVPAKYRVMNIPKLLLFKNGNVVAELVGSGSSTKTRLQEAFDKALLP